MQRFRLIVVGLALAAAFASPPQALAYGWPIKPFERQHPVRAVFGEPRTAFDLLPGEPGLNGPGRFGFSDGIDIAAAAGTEVYPVASGRVIVRDATSLRVVTPDGRAFDYRNIAPLVGDDALAVAGVTRIGVVPGNGEPFHFAELVSGVPVNPLQAGHLAPYADPNRPVVRRLLVRDADGRRIGPLGVCERISLVADAFDVPATREKGAWRGMRNVPALVRWQLVQVASGNVVQDETHADFRETLPPSERFWQIFARGTYENMPRFGGRRIAGLPGRYLFSLTPNGLDTTKLANAAYAVTVSASDLRGHRSVLTRRFTVFNVRFETGERGCPGGP